MAHNYTDNSNMSAIIYYLRTCVDKISGWNVVGLSEWVQCWSHMCTQLSACAYMCVLGFCQSDIIIHTTSLHLFPTYKAPMFQWDCLRTIISRAYAHVKRERPGSEANAKGM